MRFAVAFLVAFGMLSGSGLVHAFSGSPTLPASIESRISDSKNHCHVGCYSLNTQKQNRLKAVEDDDDPNSFINEAPSEQAIAVYYAVLFAVLTLALLQRRPPDLLVLCALRRN